MAAPRKVFRIEEMAGPQRAAQVDEAQQPGLTEIMHELGALRVMLSGSAAQQAAGSSALPRDEVEHVASKLRLIRSTITGAGHEQAKPNGSRLPRAQTTRIASELEAVMQGSEQATQKILAAAEEIDQLANNLAAALKGRLERELAQDIADSALRIFEACNFQDLIGQRVAKVMKTLKVEEALSPPASDDAPDLHGPRLDGDKGHLSQRDIDAMFEG